MPQGGRRPPPLSGRIHPACLAPPAAPTWLGARAGGEKATRRGGLRRTRGMRGGRKLPFRVCMCGFLASWAFYPSRCVNPGVSVFFLVFSLPLLFRPCCPAVAAQQQQPLSLSLSLSSCPPCAPSGVALALPSPSFCTLCAGAKERVRAWMGSVRCAWGHASRSAGVHVGME